LSRASFGTRGANIPAILRAIVACGWFGIQTWIGGTALDVLFGMLWKGWNGIDAIIGGVSLHTWLGFAVFWGIQVVIILRGIEGIKYLESWSAPYFWEVARFCSGGPRQPQAASDTCSANRPDFKRNTASSGRYFPRL
jgi:cytosine/uracil/thiamine/allantoin permease